MTAIVILLLILKLWLAVGLVFGLAFVLAGLARVQDSARGAGLRVTAFPFQAFGFVALLILFTMPFVAEPVEVTGALSRLAGLEILEIGAGSVHRLP